MTPEKAISLVVREHPNYVIEWCVPYKNFLVVLAHSNDGPEDQEHGPYPDPFYAVDKITGRVRPFIPLFEPDMGRSFFATVEALIYG